jgi:hypothetical protein
MGGGTLSDKWFVNDNSEVPAAAAAESFTNSRLDTGYLPVGAIISFFTKNSKKSFIL